MIPFDPVPSNIASIPENKGSESHAPAKTAHREQKKILPEADPATPPAGSAAMPAPAAVDGDELPPCWQLGPNDPANSLYIYGPKAAVLDEAPPANPDLPEPEETVGEELTARQLAFCERYVESPIATRAAVRAGYSEKTASQQASRLLKHPRVMRRILDLRRKRHLEQAYRRETLMDKLEVVFAEAIERREFYAAIQALTMQARMAGFTEAMPGVRYVRQVSTAGEQVVWDAVNRLEQKLCEITVGDFPGAKAAVRVAVVTAGNGFLNVWFDFNREDRKSTRLNSSHLPTSRMPSSA